MQSELSIVIAALQRYHMQQCVAKMSVPIVHTQKVKLNDAYKQGRCLQKLSIAIVQTKVVSFKLCAPKLL